MFRFSTAALCQPIVARQLGFNYIRKNPTVKNLIQDKKEILGLLNSHGCICLKNVNFNEKDMYEFTKGVWDQVILLPSFLAFNNQDPIYKQVARVGNVLQNGTLKESQKEAAYWHQDGDFWGEQKKHIFNVLHTREIPQVGGETYVMDLVAGANFLRQQKPAVYKRLKNLLGALNIEEIEDFKLYNAKNILNIDTVTDHNLVHYDEANKRERLFLSVQTLIDRQSKNKVKDITIEEVLDILEKEMGFYAHKWEKGDLLIWDNLQVMHRSSGSFQGRRLLFRTQGKFN